MGSTFDDVRVTGTFRHANSISPTIARTNLAQQDLEEFAIDLTSCRVHDSFATNLPAAGATDDLGLVGGTFGTNAPSLQTEDLKAAGATSNYARFQVILPPNYVAAQTVKIRVFAGMKTTVSDTTATVDIECYKSDEDDTVSADLCATAAQSMNTIIGSATDLDFTITSSALSPGDILDVRITTAINDGATVTAVIGYIGAIKLLCDTQG